MGSEGDNKQVGEDGEGRPAGAPEGGTQGDMEWTRVLKAIEVSGDLQSSTLISFSLPSLNHLSPNPNGCCKRGFVQIPACCVNTSLIFSRAHGRLGFKFFCKAHAPPATRRTLLFAGRLAFS